MLTILLSSNADKSAPVLPARAVDSVHEYASDFMEWNISGNPDDPYALIYTPDANYDQLDSNAPEGTAEHLNYKVATTSYDNMNNLTNTGTYVDLVRSASYMADEEIRLVYNKDASISFIPVNAPVNVSYLYSYYETIKPILYFDSTIEGEKNIHFFIKPTVDEDSINAFINHYDVVGSIPLLTINDKYQIITIDAKGKDKGFTFKTFYGSKIELNHYQSQASTTAGQPRPVIKVTMPYINSITQIESLNMGLTESPTTYVAKTDFYFRLHADLAGLYYFYVFDLCGFSAINGHIIVDNSTYTNYHGYDYNYMAELVSMKFMYTHTTKKTVDIRPKALPDNVTIIGNNIELTKFASEIHEVTFDPNIGYADGKIRYWCFEDQWKPGEFDTGEIKILEIKWHPRSGNTISDVVEVHDYSKVDIHKYSFNASKSIRTYYYEMSSYSRAWSANDNHWLYYAGGLLGTIIGVAKEAKYQYECFGFNFFFDKQRTIPIPNVKKVVIKYQCGYKEPNSASGSNGWYPNTKDPRKDVIIRTMEPSGSNFFGSHKLDEYGMVLANDLNRRMRTDDYGNEFDWVIYKQIKHRDVNTYISKMDNLEITYISENQEAVRMVANSRGLHAVLDDDGSYRVYDSEGNYCPDYGVGTGQDDTPFVGEDKNNDGIISTDEAVDSDTGTIIQQVPTWADIAKDNNTFKQTISIVIGALFLVALILVIVFNPGLLVKISKGIMNMFASIGKAIANAFRSLAMAFKKRKSSKKKTTPNKKRKGATYKQNKKKSKRKK